MQKQYNKEFIIMSNSHKFTLDFYIQILIIRFTLFRNGRQKADNFGLSA